MVFGLGPGEEVRKYQRSRESARHIHPEVIDILVSKTDQPSEGKHRNKPQFYFYNIIFLITIRI